MAKGLTTETPRHREDQDQEEIIRLLGFGLLCASVSLWLVLFTPRGGVPAVVAAAGCLRRPRAGPRSSRTPAGRSPSPPPAPGPGRGDGLLTAPPAPSPSRLALPC